DAKRQREDDGDREAGTTAHRSRRVAGILPKPIDPAGHPHAADLLFDADDVAELAHGRGTGFVPRHAAREAVLGFALDVIADLAIEVVEVWAADHDVLAVLVLRIRAIAPASRSHLPVSTASCL